MPNVARQFMEGSRPITVRQVQMARKRRERKNTGLFDVPDRRHDGDDGDSVGVFGGPTHSSRLFGGPGHPSGLFDAPDRTPGDMPGLLVRPGPGTGDGKRWLTKPRDGSGKTVGLFDKPPRSGRA